MQENSKDETLQQIYTPKNTTSPQLSGICRYLIQAASNTSVKHLPTISDKVSVLT